MSSSGTANCRQRINASGSVKDSKKSFSSQKKQQRRKQSSDFTSSDDDDDIEMDEIEISENSDKELEISDEDYDDSNKRTSISNANSSSEEADYAANQGTKRRISTKGKKSAKKPKLLQEKDMNSVSTDSKKVMI